MQRSQRLLGSILVLGAVAIGATGTAAASAPPKTVTASVITRRTGTLAPGTKVKSSSLGQRVFTDAKHGFALASVGSAQYPAATTDGGTIWKTDGPALHIDAAQAPLSVLDIGAASTKTVFAYGGGQVVDTTSDGGKKWYGALFQGLVMGVVRNAFGHLVAFVDGTGATAQYVSKNGGRTWQLNNAVGGS
jgi:hypothetical protein